MLIQHSHCNNVLVDKTILKLKHKNRQHQYYMLELKNERPSELFSNDTNICKARLVNGLN